VKVTYRKQFSDSGIWLKEYNTHDSLVTVDFTMAEFEMLGHFADKYVSMVAGMDNPELFSALQSAARFTYKSGYMRRIVFDDVWQNKLFSMKD